MKKLRLILTGLMAFLSVAVQSQTVEVPGHSAARRVRVLLQTTKGNIVVELYNETPGHRDNFVKLVKDGYYDGNLWHRVIADFMIQTGDSTTRHARPGDVVGHYSPDYRIPAEIVFPQFFHKRGALAAAREGDSRNPGRASSASQFYIVYGNTYSSLSLDKVQARMDEVTGGQVKLTDDIRDHYRKYGGSPHLDGQYTVFGEVVEGLEVVRELNHADTDDYDRPTDDLRIIRATVVN